jgi:hypothetical protein
VHQKLKRRRRRRNEAKHAYLLLDWILRVVLDPETNIFPLI